MDPVICLAHGSRHPDADAAIARIAASVGRLSGVSARPAYLDFSPLTLSVAADLLAAAGQHRATVVPLLFTRAFHLRHDVPAALETATAATGVRFRLARGIGTGDDVAGLLASRIPCGTGSLVLYSVGSSVAGADDMVAGLAVRAGLLAGIPAKRTRLVTATGKGSTGPDALVQAVDAAAGHGAPVHVVPLFTAPGTLWDAACGALADREIRRGAGAVPVTTGVPLDTAVAPLIDARTRAGVSR